eukprot:Anaeramoba_flamelloidesa334890_26.p1 GENE.a334890_26~~a334890_26.p1  ORF type:complete len:410 (+),score=22.22 a334890_26:16-1245(+)
MLFSNFNLSDKLQETIKKTGYTSATSIQEKTIPKVLEGCDIIAKAQTGSGKTAAFVLPIINTIQTTKGEGKAKIKALVLTPTRELTIQVEEVFKGFDPSLKTVSLIGGKGIGEQLYTIQQGCDIVIATAGRLLDIFTKKQMNLSHLKYFVLDEADKMLNLGFEEELDAILAQIPKDRQNLMFSATYPQKVLDIISKVSANPIKITIQEQSDIVNTITQRVIEVNKENKSALLRKLIKENNFKSVLVFMSNKRSTDNISAKYRKYGFEAESLHGDLEQDERIATLKDFKDGHIKVLFATDIASRGLDIDDISCVVNYELPRSTADYVHRIGRTARAGKNGLAISFIDFEDFDHFKLIEKRYKISIQREQIDGFELKGKAPIKKKGAAPVKGKRKSKKDKLREKEVANKKQ